MKQTVFFDNNLRDLKRIINENSSERILLVSAKKSYSSSGAEKIINDMYLKQKIIRYFEFEQNPKIEDIKKGIELYHKIKPELVIAIGGGSVIDTAKLINLLSFQEGEPEAIIKNSKLIKHPSVPIIAIPTTAGTGSEATHFAVVYINKIKYSLTHKYVLPNYVFLAERLTYNLPEKLTAYTGLDALSQAVEAIWAIDTNEEAIEYSKEAVSLILKFLPQAVLKKNKIARKQMLKASFLAGKAINISKTSAPHAVSYPFTTHYGLLHGHAVALTLPSFLEFNYNLSEIDNNEKRGVLFVKNNIEIIFDLLKTDAKNAKNVLSKFIESLGVCINIGEIIQKNFDFDLIIENVGMARLENNPRKINKTNLLNILKKLF